MEKLIHAHVFTRLSHSQKFIRARACWVIKEASETSYSTQKILHQVIEGLCDRLVRDQELPVKVEAAIAIQHLLQDQEGKSKVYDLRMKYIAESSYDYFL